MAYSSQGIPFCRRTEGFLNDTNSPFFFGNEVKLMGPESKLTTSIDDLRQLAVHVSFILNPATGFNSAKHRKLITHAFDLANLASSLLEKYQILLPGALQFPNHTIPHSLDLENGLPPLCFNEWYKPIGTRGILTALIHIPSITQGSSVPELEVNGWRTVVFDRTQIIKRK